MNRRQILSTRKKLAENSEPRFIPRGYHVMPDGSLMSDYDHEVMEENQNVLPVGLQNKRIPLDNPYITKYKYIHGININLNDININGETRSFSIIGDNGAQFSLQILDTTSGGKYYDFNTATWTTAEQILTNQVIRNGSYKGSITFEAPGKLHNYEIRLIAIPSGCDPTKHVAFIPAYSSDNTIDYNRSIGSDSAILIKKINSQVGSQSIITLSCISPSLGDSGEVNIDMTPDPGSTTGAATINLSTGESLNKFSFSITLTAGSGKAFAIQRTPTIDDLCALRTVTFGSAALPIENEDTSSSTYYQWPVDNIAGLQNGMVLDPSSTTGGNVTAGSLISDYVETMTETKHISVTPCEQDRVDITTDVVILPGVAATGDPTVTRGYITAQAGNLIFNKQQADALKSDSNVRVIGYGRNAIRSMTFGTDVELSNVKLELTEISTTVNDASMDGSTAIDDFDVASVTGIMNGVSVLEAANTTVTAAKPVVNAISDPNIQVTGTHALQNGQTVKFLGASNIVTITGDIKIHKMGLHSATLYFDVERFLLSK